MPLKPAQKIVFSSTMILAAFVFALGCGPQDAGPSERFSYSHGKADDSAETGLLLIDASQNGQTFEVSERTVVILDLDGTPSSGYRWEVLSTDTLFGQPKSTTFTPSGFSEFAWLTDRSMVGTHAVLVGKMKSTNPGAQPLMTFAFTVIVTPAAIVPPAAKSPCPVSACQNDCEKGFVYDQEGECETCRCRKQSEEDCRWIDDAFDACFYDEESEEPHSAYHCAYQFDDETLNIMPGCCDDGGDADGEYDFCPLP